MECNPLRAGLVADLADYRWSSYRAHGLGEQVELLAAAPVWAGLGRTAAARQRYWRQWLHTPMAEKELAAVRRSVSSGRPYGATGWVEKMAAALGLDLRPRPRGRPAKQSKKMN